MNPFDPAVAALRCWEHEDCLEHPELGRACAGGAVVYHVAGISDFFSHKMSGYPPLGNNYGWEHDGDGEGHGDQGAVGYADRLRAGNGRGGGWDCDNQEIVGGAPSTDRWVDGTWTYHQSSEYWMCPGGSDVRRAESSGLLPNEGW